jgi:hypothetical protein
MIGTEDVLVLLLLTLQVLLSRTALAPFVVALLHFDLLAIHAVDFFEDGSEAHLII